MISHVFVGVNDFEHAFRFYSGLMQVLGHGLKFNEPGKPWAGWVSPHAPRPLFVIGRPFDGAPATIGNGHMTALLAADRDTVDSAYSTALSNGGTCDGAPGLRPQYHPHYYDAYFRDPEGNKLCVCCHDPA
jgi:catechol 2,3-dioxygenase-like lactoylglutathione lyase family enzyme